MPPIQQVNQTFKRANNEIPMETDQSRLIEG
jgi:hypothetical protein